MLKYSDQIWANIYYLFPIHTTLKLAYTNTKASLFAVSQIRGLPPRLKIYHPNPSMDKSIRTFQQLEKFLQPYRIMFKELGVGKGRSSFNYVSEKKKL